MVHEQDEYKNEVALESAYIMPTFARKPVELVQGKGMALFDSYGESYLDFIAGIGVVSLGHCHPAVVNALTKQASKLIQVGNYYYIENRGEVARMLSLLLDDRALLLAQELSRTKGKKTQTSAVSEPADNASMSGSTSSQDGWKTFFANSGAEANECAIKVARLRAKKQGREANLIVSLNGSFHGRTLATLAATGQPAKQDAFQPLPRGFIHVPLNDKAALNYVFEEHGEAICAVMLECIQGESGVHPCDADFIALADKLAHDHDALLICDEIQTGIYRCGSHPFAFQHYGVSPDIVTIAKGVASGFPTGMCSVKGMYADTFQPGDHGTTFGGGCLAIAAAKATLETLVRGNFGEYVEKVGAYLRAGLQTLPHVVSVRGLGLMCGCDLEEGLSAPGIVDKALDKGLLINATGQSTLRFLPPLICGEDEVDILIAQMHDILSTV